MKPHKMYSERCAQFLSMHLSENDKNTKKQIRNRQTASWPLEKWTSAKDTHTIWQEGDLSPDCKDDREHSCL